VCVIFSLCMCISFFLATLTPDLRIGQMCDGRMMSEDPLAFILYILHFVHLYFDD